MTLLKKSAIALITSGLILSQATARDQIRIVGSSTVYPFSSSVAEELGATSKFPTPVVESTGSGGGMKLFCAGNDLNTPDITNASRRMKTKEFDMCEKNGVTDITEAVIGFDGIVFAQSKSNVGFTLTKKHLLLAVAAEVPNEDGTKLIPNPYKNWKQIDSNLPDREIIIYGPPKSSGTRDAFEDMVLKGQTKKMKVYKDAGYKKYHKIRTDGIYVPSGENDNLIVQKLEKNKKSFGIFGYSFLIENAHKIKASRIEGVIPDSKTISNGKYPISRSLFFYTKNSHRSSVPAMDKYVEMFMSEDMIGEDGILGEIGLIPLPKERREQIQKAVLSKTKLTKADLKSH
jgi:phosphate transport system substrate-binding protein